MGAQTADRWARHTIRAGRCSLDWLVVEEVTQLDVGLWADIAELSTNRDVRFLLLGDFRQLPAVQDAFGGAPVLRSLKESQLAAARPGRGPRARAHGEPEERRQNLSFLEWRKWTRRSRDQPAADHARVAGLRLVGAKVAKSLFVEVKEVGERFLLDDRQRASRPRSCCAPRGSATPSPTRAARSLRCASGSGCDADNPPLSREGVVSSHSVVVTGLSSRHGSEFCTSEHCRFAGLRPGAPTILGALKSLQNGI